MVGNAILGYTRPKICLYIAALSATGFLLSGPVSGALFLLTLAAYCFAGAVYSFNMLTDKEEDKANGSFSSIAETLHGKTIPAAFFALGSALSLHVSAFSFTIYLFACSLGFIYSALRLKKIFGLKNVYTVVVTSLVFFLGASYHGINQNIAINAIAVSLPVLIVSMLGDLRDHDGDRKSGVRTIPAALGYLVGKRVTYALYGTLSLSIALFRIQYLIPLFPFLVLSLNSLRVGDHKSSQLFVLVGVIAIPAVMLWK